MTGYINVRESLKKFRLSKGFTIEDFSSELGLKPRKYEHYEKTGRLPVSALISVYKLFNHNLIGRNKDLNHKGATQVLEKPSKVSPLSL